MRANKTNCFLHRKIRAIRVIRGRIPGKMSQNTAEFGRKWQNLAENGRIWQNLAERYSLVQVQTFQYAVNKRVTKNEGQKYTSASQTPILAVGVFKYLPHTPKKTMEPPFRRGGQQGKRGIAWLVVQ